MSLLSRIANVFRGERLNREIDEESQPTSMRPSSKAAILRSSRHSAPRCASARLLTT